MEKDKDKKCLELIASYLKEKYFKNEDIDADSVTLIQYLKKTLPDSQKTILQDIVGVFLFLDEVMTFENVVLFMKENNKKSGEWNELLQSDADRMILLRELEAFIQIQSPNEEEEDSSIADMFQSVFLKWCNHRVRFATTFGEIRRLSESDELPQLADCLLYYFKNITKCVDVSTLIFVYLSFRVFYYKHLKQNNSIKNPGLLMGAAIGAYKTVFGGNEKVVALPLKKKVIELSDRFYGLFTEISKNGKTFRTFGAMSSFNSGLAQRDREDAVELMKSLFNALKGPMSSRATVHKHYYFMFLMLLVEQKGHSKLFEKGWNMLLKDTRQIQAFHNHFDVFLYDGVLSLPVNVFLSTTSKLGNVKAKFFIMMIYKVQNYHEKTRTISQKIQFLECFNLRNEREVFRLVNLFSEKVRDPVIFNLYIRRNFIEKNECKKLLRMTTDKKKVLKIFDSVIDFLLDDGEKSRAMILGISDLFVGLNVGKEIQEKRRRVLQIVSDRIPRLKRMTSVKKVVACFFTQSDLETVPIRILEAMVANCKEIEETFSWFLFVCQLMEVCVLKKQFDNAERLLRKFFEDPHENVGSKWLVDRSFIPKMCKERKRGQETTLYRQICAMYAKFVFLSWEREHNNDVFSFEEQIMVIEHVLNKIWVGDPTRFVVMCYEMGLRMCDKSGFFDHLIVDVGMKDTRIIHYFGRILKNRKLFKFSLESYEKVFCEVIVSKLEKLKNNVSMKKINFVQFKRLKGLLFDINRVLIVCNIDPIQEHLMSEIENDFEFFQAKVKELEQLTVSVTGADDVSINFSTTPLDRLMVNVDTIAGGALGKDSYWKISTHQKVEKLMNEKMKKSQEIIKKQQEILSVKRKIRVLKKSKKCTRAQSYFSIFDEDEKRRMDPSRQYRERLFVGFDQKIHDIKFLDSGRDKDFKEYFEMKTSEIVDQFVETIVLDRQNDVEIDAFLVEAKEIFETKWKEIQVELKEIRAKRKTLEKKEESLDEMIPLHVQYFIGCIIESVADFFGGVVGDSGSFNIIDDLCTKSVADKRMEKKMIYLGELKGRGVCRHRSILFKAVCDLLGIHCCLMRGKYRKTTKKTVMKEYDGVFVPEDTSVFEYHDHCWNIVQLSDDLFIVDCNRSLNLLHGRFRDGYISFGGNIFDYDQETSMREEMKLNFRISQDTNIGGGTISQVYLHSNGHFFEFPKKKPKDKKVKYFGGRVKVEKTVAVKVYNTTNLSSSHGVSSRKAIKKEELVLRLMNHPNIVRYFVSFDRKTKPKARTFGKENHFFYIVMEHLNATGKQILGILNNPKNDLDDTQKLIEVLILFIGILNGLRYLHSLQIIHFDLHLGNILFEWNENEKRIEHVRICDFGSSKEQMGTTTVPHMHEDIIAPEIRKLQLVERIRKKQERKFTPKSDIYSFGVIMKFFEKIYEGFSEIERLQKDCVVETPSKRPAPEHLIFVFRSYLQHLDGYEQDEIKRKINIEKFRELKLEKKLEVLMKEEETEGEEEED